MSSNVLKFESENSGATLITLHRDQTSSFVTNCSGVNSPSPDSTACNATNGSLNSDICPICSIIVSEIDCGLLCDECSYWCHASCLNISKTLYNELNKATSTVASSNMTDCIKIVCPRCQTKCSDLSPEILLTDQNTQDSAPGEINPNSDKSSPDPSFSLVQGAGNSLSNFFPFTFSFKGVIHSSAEHCYQFERAKSLGLHDLASSIKSSATAA